MEKAIKKWIKHHFLMEKLDTVFGAVLLLLLSVFVAIVVGKFGLLGGGGLLVVTSGVFLVLGAIFNIYLGLYVILIMSILVSYLPKIVNAPYGLSLDLLLVVLAMGVIMKQLKDRDLSFAKNPISLPIVVWVFYNMIQVINPVATSQLAWAFTVRSMALLILLYFIASYALNSYQRIVNIIKFMIGLAFISALYGLKQEFYGFADFELEWLYADPVRFQLIFQWSRMRVFSFFSDPTNYGIYMSYMAMLCFILMLCKFKMWQKVFLGFAGGCMILAIAFAGSRTPMVLIPFGFAVFTMLTMKRNIIIAMIFLGMLGGIFVLKSTGNAVIFRIQSAFMPERSGDTMGVRFENQKKIKPFIQSHPFGAGLGTVGEWGERFSPGTFLAGFPPDSGYVRVAIELGWIGYILYCWLLFTIVRIGIRYYLRVNNHYLKNIYLALTTMIFMLILASYVQEAIVTLPTSIHFYIFVAIMVRLKDFEEEADLVYYGETEALEEKS